MQRIQQVWPEWQVDELIGQGGFGRVYKASRTVGGHTSYAAIKVIDIPQSDDEVSELRQMGMDALSIRSHFEERAHSLFEEISLLDVLKGSPHVVHIEDYQLREHEDGIGWTVLIRMELLEPLSRWVERCGLPDQRESVKIGIQICDALIQCHTTGIVHRDVKPANVFRSTFGDYKLGDFGIARKLSEGTRSTKSVAGTRPYMAPEVESGHYDARVDIYSLGIMLYRWLNGGKPPFVRPNEAPSQAILERAQYRRLTGERPPLPAGEGTDTGLAQIVRRAIEPRPEERWQDAEAFRGALQEWAKGLMAFAMDAIQPASDVDQSMQPSDDVSSMQSVDAQKALKAVLNHERREDDQVASQKKTKSSQSNRALDTILEELNHLSNDESRRLHNTDRASVKRATQLPDETVVYWVGLAAIIVLMLVVEYHLNDTAARVGFLIVSGLFLFSGDWSTILYLLMGQAHETSFIPGERDGDSYINEDIGIKISPSVQLGMNVKETIGAYDLHLGARTTDESKVEAITYVGHDANESCCWLAFDGSNYVRDHQSARSYVAESLIWQYQIAEPEAMDAIKLGNRTYYCVAYRFASPCAVVYQYVDCKWRKLLVFTIATDDTPAGSEARRMLAECITSL